MTSVHIASRPIVSYSHLIVYPHVYVRCSSPHATSPPLRHVCRDRPDSPEEPEWGEDDAERAERIGLTDGSGDEERNSSSDAKDGGQQSQQKQIEKANTRGVGKLRHMKSRIVRSIGSGVGRSSAQQANALPGDAPAANSQGGGEANGKKQGEGGGNGKGDGQLQLAQQPMLSRDDNIPMPIPPAALRVAKERKSHSSPALLQKEQFKKERKERKEEEEKQQGGGEGSEKPKKRKELEGAPPLQRAASHDFGFDVEELQTEALMSGTKGYMQWKDVSYTVTLDDGTQKTLLNQTFGYVRPGVMVNHFMPHHSTRRAAPVGDHLSAHSSSHGLPPPLCPLFSAP